MRCMEKVTWKLIFKIFKIDSQQEFAVWLRKLTTRGMGWGGKWREVQNEGDMCIPMADSC